MNSQQIFDDFPEMYNAMMRPVFECNEGWMQLIYDLSAELTRVSNDAGVEPPKASQVKEKFGSLRFYIRPVNETIKDEVIRLISLAEEQSIQTCEMCGNVGELRNINGVVLTLCDDHLVEKTNLLQSI